ncbi:hypothetical protein GCM10022416_49110 [Actinomadura keratinilytica]|uniref:Uncharacterized protein n=1 Tax=Actinomadura keratinilytica TaxID=547461 RepID=A0ABP7ZAH9_9ACTN
MAAGASAVRAALWHRRRVRAGWDGGRPPDSDAAALPTLQRGRTRTNRFGRHPAVATRSATLPLATRPSC